MQRHKLLALVVGALAALAGASISLLGNAQAATWHDYKGDLYPGHAYGLQVPAQARAYEVLLEGDANATATLSVLDPDGKALGHHVLTAESPSFLVEAPAQGRHALYVYDLKDGALKLRVDAVLAPLSVGLQKLPLHESAVTLAANDDAAPLDVSRELTLPATPVFLTLLYEGSVQGLDATISSGKGDVVTIRGESGTAFAPGVWSHLRGERSSEPANLEGTVFGVVATAQRFEGALTLTALTIDQTVPAETGEAPAPAPAPAPGPAPVPVNGAFTAPVGKPMAFEATAGALRVTSLAPAEKDDEARAYWTGALALYDPEDALLAYVELSDREPNATVDLPVDGEYVVYVHDAPEAGLLVQLVGASTVAGVRELAVGTEAFEFDVSSGLLRMGDEDETFAILHSPVAMALELDGAGDALLSSVTVENENGVVVGTATFLGLAGTPAFEQGSYQEPENFAAGEHVLRAEGLTEGTVRLVSTHYLRQDAPPAEAPAAEAAPPVPEEPAATEPSGNLLKDVLRLLRL